MEDIYTPREAAYEVIAARQNDPAVREKVIEYLGGLLPDTCLQTGNRIAILPRYVARGTQEDRIYAEAAQEAGFTPYWATYKADRFTVRNPEKVETIRPPIWWPKGQKTRSWIVEPEKREGGIGQLETIYGYSSSEYQARIRGLVFGQDGISDLAANEFDMGKWYRLQAERFGFEQGSLATYYYIAYMALATTFCAVFEDFDGGPNANGGDLASFTSQVVYSAIAKVQRELGLQPVIVRLPYTKGMNETDLSFLDNEQTELFRCSGATAVFGTMEGNDEQP